MATVKIFFEDTDDGLVIDYEGDPDFDMSKPDSELTTAQSIAKQAIELLLQELEDSGQATVIHATPDGPNSETVH